MHKFSEFRPAPGYTGAGMDSSWIPVTVAAIAAGPAHTDPVLLLRSMRDEQLVGLPLGAAEAGSIVLALEGAVSSEPQTHDLFVTLFELHGLRARHVMIYGGDGQGRYARLSYSGRSANYSLRVRPSDGIAIAVRMGAPIYLHSSLCNRESFDASAEVSAGGYSYLPLDRAQSARSEGPSG